MNQFVNSILTQETQTTNGMKALKGTGDPVMDLFYKVGAMRGQNVIPQFVGAYAENPDLATRVMLWARDVREGAGERQLFRDVLSWLEHNDFERFLRVIELVPTLGRWDDLWAATTTAGKHAVFELVMEAVVNGNGLAAKWTPRKGPLAEEFRKWLGISHKEYRKMLVGMTKVVETQMCDNQWDQINFSHVPSQASRIYKKAFNRHTPRFKEYVQALVSGDTQVKVNAGAVYPYEVLKPLIRSTDWNPLSQTEKDHIVQQWNALPNWLVNNTTILPMVDVSGSMNTPAGKNTEVTCLDVAVSLGLYLSDKTNGAFKDVFLTFSEHPEILKLKGTISQKVQQMKTSDWGMNTNLVSALQLVLNLALDNRVPQSDMPEVLLILSDMQFDHCCEYRDSAVQAINRRFLSTGYKMPQVVFWNLNSHENVPVKAREDGVALVSGFSPSIVKSVLITPREGFTPVGVMMNTIMKDRYSH
jgi:hypothetical protein